MRISASAFALGLGLCLWLPTASQHVGLFQSDETMDGGVLQATGAPIVAFGNDGAHDDFAVVAGGGHGFTDRFHAEADLGFVENGAFVGVDGEFWILTGKERNVGSLSRGLD